MEALRRARSWGDLQRLAGRPRRRGRDAIIVAHGDLGEIASRDGPIPDTDTNSDTDADADANTHVGATEDANAREDTDAQEAAMDVKRLKALVTVIEVGRTLRLSNFAHQRT
ncbi:hypothetical protein FNV62_42530 [Streptomyces sp. RLB3-17]|nr:hypothetical protein FNV62_42530 [Streptomyces sp. RLB3-17]